MYTEKTCIILRGLPGSGKSCLAGLLFMLAETGHVKCEVCSADDYHINPETGKYEFDPDRVSECHDLCKDKFTKCVLDDTQLIVVDNTNTMQWQFDFYEKIALENGYKVFHLIVENRHGGTSVHGVPSVTVNRMRDDFEIQLG